MNKRQEMFNFLEDQFGFIATESEMEEIYRIVEKDKLMESAIIRQRNFFFILGCLIGILFAATSFLILM